MIPLSGDLAKAKGIKSESVDSIGVTKGTSILKRGFAHMLKNGVVMDVTTVEQAQIAEELVLFLLWCWINYHQMLERLAVLQGPQALE